MEFNKSTVKFMKTPDGIRGAIYIGNEFGAHMCAPTYIHRYECAIILGLKRESDKASDGFKIEWKRFLDKLDSIEEEMLTVYKRTVGFTFENSQSSDRQGSEYELKIPEYIDTDAVLLVAMRLRNETAAKFRAKVIQEIIPFYQKYANPQQVANVPILNQITDSQNQFTCSGPMSMNILQARKNMLNNNLNQLSHFDKMINGVNQSQLSLDELWDQLITWVGNYIENTYDISISSCCYDMLSKVYTHPVVNKSSIIECILGNTWLFDIAMRCISLALEDIEIDAVDRANNFDFKNKAKLEQCDNPIEAQNIDTGKEVVKFEYQFNRFNRPKFI